MLRTLDATNRGTGGVASRTETVKSKSTTFAAFATFGAFVTFLHLNRWQLFVLINFDGQNAHHVIMQTHQAFHFLYGGRWCVRTQEGIVALAVFVDLVGHRFDAPVFAVDELAVVVSQNCAEMFDKAFCLRVGQILTRNHNMLIKRHVHSYLYQGAFHRQGICVLRPHHESLRGSKDDAKRTAHIQGFHS